MKKIQSFIATALFILASVIMLNSCENIDHPIAGHTYSHDFRITEKRSGIYITGAGPVTYISFYSNGNVVEEDKMYKENATSPYLVNKTEHMKFKVDGNAIIIYRDNSTYWKASVRGEEVERYIYNSTDNTLKTSNSGALYKLWK